MLTTDNNTKLRINFNLKPMKSGNSQIWLTCTINNERARIYTGELINKEYWIKKARREIGECANTSNSLGKIVANKNKEINKRLKEIIGFCDDYLRLASNDNLMSKSIEYNKDAFEEYIYNRIKDIKNTTKDFILSYIERKKQTVNRETGVKISTGTIYNHTNALQRLEEFCNDKSINLNWNIFNKDFEEAFTSWLLEQNYAPNTIASQFSIIKVWLKEAEEKGIITDKSFHHYQTKCREVENIYLTEDEIKKIYNIDFTKDEIKAQIDPKSRIEITRDLFIIACWTGLRYGDWRDLSNANISNDTMIVHTHKTRQTVEIPLHPIVKDILKKYDGKLPKCVDRSKSLRHIRKCAQIAGINNNITLSKIRGGKCIVETKPKFNCIMNHTARRTFATLMYLKGIPAISIMAITGHTTEENFMKYIKLDKSEHAKIVAKAFRE